MGEKNEQSTCDLRKYRREKSRWKRGRGESKSETFEGGERAFGHQRSLASNWGPACVREGVQPWSFTTLVAKGKKVGGEGIPSGKNKGEIDAPLSEEL